VTFDGRGSTDPDGTVTTWAWSFGDGVLATGPVTTHVYSAPGTYTASLTATDDRGAASTTTLSIVVNAAALAAPTNLTATALSKSSIGLKWTNRATGQEVRIERCRGAACMDFVQVAVRAGTATAFTDSGLARWTTYRYRVRAHDALGDSAYSNIAGARTRR
jgi:PKD repeat protein